VTTHLFHAFATFVPGGPQVRTARVLSVLGGEFRHTILPLDGRSEARALLDPAVEATFPAPPERRGTLAVLGHVRRALRAARPDLLLTYNWGAIEALAAGLLERIPVLHHEDGFLSDEARAFKRRRVLARRLLLPRTRGVVVPSRTLEAIALGPWGLAPERVHRIPNGLRIEDFPPRDGNPALRAELGIPRDAFLVGSVGHLRPEKNLARLVEAFARLASVPEAHLVLVGDGPDATVVRARARELGVEARVHVAGHQPRPQPYYRACDAFALSSDTEQMPLSLLEAMASALPVVSTDVGDVREVLPAEQHALLVPATAPDAAALLAGALETLTRAPERARALGERNRERVRSSFAFERTVARYRELYRGKEFSAA
jgi:glycosyltransferase involved in cell wall biosynthesis